MMSSHGTDSYHATVAQMAERYSHHHLPNPSDLIDENEEHLLESPGFDHELEMYEEEDKDLQSVLSSHTTIYHDHLKANSKSSSKKVSFNFDNIPTMNAISPRTEIREIQNDKALFLDIFNEYFDESKEGDVDFDEFKNGLSKLDIQMSDAQMNKLFHVLLLNGDADDTETDYLQSEQFVDFLTRRFTAAQTVQFQNILLKAIRSKSNISSNFKPEQAEKWQTTQLNLAEFEMTEAMKEMVESNMEKIKMADEFNEELERRQCDPHFCADENCENWDSYEVAYWVSKIIGFGQGDFVKKRFFDAQIDGNVLLHDVDANMLMNELCFPRLHVAKFLRILAQLKANKKDGKMALIQEFIVNDFEFLSETQENNMKIRQKLDEIESKCDDKVLEYKQENIALNANVNELKERMYSMQSAHEKELNEYKLSRVQVENKLIDYESMKASYDSICAQLNESKQALCSLKSEFENVQQQHQNEVKHDELLPDNAADWTTKEVGIWLNNIGMSVYTKMFVDQFVDGQILLHDITQQNLISDLGVKSIHVRKIMRELKKLNGFDPKDETFEICDNVTSSYLESKQSTLLQQIDTLKNDLSEARIKLNNKRLQIEDLSRERRKLSKMSHMSMTSVLSADQSVYSEGGFKRSTLSPNLGATKHIMDDYDLPQEEISENWRKYVEGLENKYSHLSSLFVRADNALKKYKVAIVPFKERISDLETQNSTRIKTIDKLKKRIDRRDETIRRLKTKNSTQQFQMPSLTNQGPIIPPNVSDSKFLNLAYKRHQNSLMMPQPPVHVHAQKQQVPMRASDDDNASVIGSLVSGVSSMAYGFFTSSDTPQ